MSNVVFISGTGRSGTYITKDILSRHSEVASLPFEHRFTIDPGGLVDFYRNVDNWSPYLADFRLKQLEYTLKQMVDKSSDDQLPYSAWELNKWIPDFDHLVDQLLEGITSFTYEASYPGRRAWLKPGEMYFFRPDKLKVAESIRTFLKACHEAILKDQGKHLFAEDNTWSILFASELVDLVEGAKMIHMVRDPRDVVASLIKQRWTPNSLEEVLIYYTDIIDTWWKQKDLLEANRCMEVRLEDMLEDASQVVGAICDFVGLEFEDTLLEIDLSKGNRGRYKEAFSKSDIEKMEKQLEPYIEYYYPSYK